MFGIEIAEEDVGGRVAVADALIYLLFDLLDYLYHHQSHVHVSLLFVAVLGVNELAQSHLRTVVRRQALVFARLAHSRGGTTKLFNALLPAEGTFLRTHISLIETAGFKAWAARASYNAALYVLDNTDCWLEA